MARPLRIEYPGALYHVTVRGNQKNAIYYDDTDRRAFLDVFTRVVDRCNWLCHAYCLMENHYHLVIETPEGNLSCGMRQLNGTYTQWYNRRHQSVGHLFQGRFKSIIVEKESYLLELCRYVVLNPTRAGMTGDPRTWRWSSYGATAGLSPVPVFLTTDWLLSQFSSEKRKAQTAYRAFVRSGIEQLESPWNHLRGRFVLGSDRFVDCIQGIIDEGRPLREVPREERLVGRPALAELFPGSWERTDRAERNRLIYDAHVRYGYTLSEIGSHLDLHYSTISKTVKHIAEKGRRDDNSKSKT